MKTIDEIRRKNLEIAIGRVRTAAALAGLIGTAPAYLSQIKRSTPDSKSGTPKTMGDDVARRIEVAIGESVGWMDADHSDIPGAHDQRFDRNVRPSPMGTRAIPVISAIQAGAMREITVPYAAGDGYATIYVDDSYSQWAFGLEIDGDSMMPDYQPGDVVIIEPEWEPRPGDCVAAKNGRQEATFKKYRLRGSTPDGNDIFELVPINDNYPTVRSDETPLTIIGVMAELRRKTRRR